MENTPTQQEAQQVSTPPTSAQQIIINQLQPRRSNGLGTAGFVLALIGLFLGWVPILGWIVWFLGLVLSFVAIFKAPRGLAIAGLVISLISVIILLVIAGAAAGVAALQ